MKDRLDTEIIMSVDDTLNMLDGLLEKWDQDWWNEFYSDKEKPIPFFVNIPDVNLVSAVKGIEKSNCRAIDIGCGNGRNSVYLAKQNYITDGIDFSYESIEWARENAKNENVEVNFINESFFDFEIGNETYDLIHDSGCLHHIKPHRRSSYLEKIKNILKPNGYFSLTCFNLKGGKNLTDRDVYRKSSMQGGMGYSEYKLRTILAQYFEIVEFKEMEEIKDGDQFGVNICWTVLMRKMF